MGKVASVSYTAESLADIANSVEHLANDEARKAQQPKVTNAVKRYHAGKRDAFQYVANMLRATTLDPKGDAALDMLKQLVQKCPRAEVIPIVSEEFSMADVDELQQRLP